MPITKIVFDPGSCVVVCPGGHMEIHIDNEDRSIQMVSAKNLSFNSCEPMHMTAAQRVYVDEVWEQFESRFVKATFRGFGEVPPLMAKVGFGPSRDHPPVQILTAEDNAVLDLAEAAQAVVDEGAFETTTALNALSAALDR